MGHHDISSSLVEASVSDIESVYEKTGGGRGGLTPEHVVERRKMYGMNSISHE